MFEKLDFVIEKYEELSMKVSDPDIIANQSVWQKYAKEMGEMEPLVKKYTEYRKAKETLAQARELLADPDDEIKEMAKMEIAETEEAIEDIFDGKMPALPTNTDAMYALTASMTAYARSHKDEMSRIANSIRYADKMPPDFGAVLMKDYMYIDKDFKERLMLIPEFAKWLQSKGSLMNGSVR